MTTTPGTEPQTAKAPRQWLDIVALIVSITAFFVPLYYSELRLADDLSVTVLSLGAGTDTNGFYTAEVGVILRNEGNRQVVIPRVSLELSETPTYDLLIGYPPSRRDPLVVGAKQTLYDELVFGAGHKKYQMIEALSQDGIPGDHGVMMMPVGAPLPGFQEPVIYGRLRLDVMDARGRVHKELATLGTLQRGDGLRISPSVTLPYTVRLLPSSSPAPRGYSSSSRSAYEVEAKASTSTNQFILVCVGPLGFRLSGVYTNKEDSLWPAKPMQGEFGVGFEGSIVDGGGNVHELRWNQTFRNPNTDERDGK